MPVHSGGMLRGHQMAVDGGQLTPWSPASVASSVFSSFYKSITDWLGSTADRADSSKGKVESANGLAHKFLRDEGRPFNLLSSAVQGHEPLTLAVD